MENIQTLIKSSDINHSLKLIDELDFNQLKIKLQDKDDGEGWDNNQCALAEVYYKRFLKLILIYPEEKLVPSKVIDTFWHYHILDTRHYIKSTKNIFGHYIHHNPYVGIGDENNKKKLNELFKNTCVLYEMNYNESFPQEVYGKCNSGGDSDGGESTCAGRCHNDN